MVFYIDGAPLNFCALWDCRLHLLARRLVRWSLPPTHPCPAAGAGRGVGGGLSGRAGGGGAAGPRVPRAASLRGLGGGLHRHSWKYSSKSSPRYVCFGVLVPLPSPPAGPPSACCRHLDFRKYRGGLYGFGNGLFRAKLVGGTLMVRGASVDSAGGGGSVRRYSNCLTC